ncbi:MAG: hypothetical protein J0H43_08415 [Actinobacteria bacterium]|nr:hypothetical protein [Actinomycetota bacterium]
MALTCTPTSESTPLTWPDGTVSAGTVRVKPSVAVGVFVVLAGCAAADACAVPGELVGASGVVEGWVTTLGLVAVAALLMVVGVAGVVAAVAEGAEAQTTKSAAVPAAQMADRWRIRSSILVMMVGRIYD